MSKECGYCIHLHKDLSGGHGSFDDYYCDYDGDYHMKTEYAEYCNGYEESSSSSSCYLTSACVGYLGKPDDCYELTTLRAFRDDHLKKTAEGSALVEEYYKIAPQIVEKIEASGKQKEYYEYIYKVVTECVACIEKGDGDGALARYRDMTLTLKEQLLG